jgi:tetratricopeptide (TPR) repeat protein
VTALLLWCIGAAWALAPLPSAPDPAAISAEDDARARELFENGAMLYDEGRYEDAIAAWTEAWRLSGRALLLFNMANAAERVGRWEDAMELLSRYRAFAPADERDVLDRRIGNIERRLGDLPAPVAPPPAVVAPEPLPAAVVTRRPFPVAPVLLFGASGAGLVTGTVFAFRALDARADADTLCTPHDGATWCPASAASALGVDRQSSLVADIALGVGLGALGGGVIALVVQPRTSMQVGVGLREGAGVLTLAGRIP